MEFAGATLTSELVQGEQVVNIPKDGHINAFRNLKMPETKTDVRLYCGMLASVQAWTPIMSPNIPFLRKVCSKNGKVEWNKEIIAESKKLMS